MRLAPLVASVSLFAALLSCDLPPGFDEVEPGEEPRPPVGTASVSAPPRPGEDPLGEPVEVWESDFVGWRAGGGFACGGSGSRPVAVELWDGVEEPCQLDEEDLSDVEGARVVRLEISDTVAGTYPVSLQCVGGAGAGVRFGIVRGGALEVLQAEEGTVTVIAPLNDVLEGSFNVRFAGQGSFTSGSFRAAVGCF